MFQTKLTNGVTVCYDDDSTGRLLLRYPDGSQVTTTWRQLGLMESVVEQLREVYEYLLLRASGAGGSDPPVDKLVELDDLLFAISQHRRPGDQSTGSRVGRSARIEPGRLAGR